MVKHIQQGEISHKIVIFVEGDTDEVFFKALLQYYRRVTNTPIPPCDVCNLKGVTRFTSKLLAKLKNDIIPEAKRKNVVIQTVCCGYDTDVFEQRNPLIVNWGVIAKQVKKMGVEHFIRIKVHSAIEDWILDDVEGVCKYLKIKQQVKFPRGLDGNARLSALFAKAHKLYTKGYATREMINALDFSKIREIRSDALCELEKALGVKG